MLYICSLVMWFRGSCICCFVYLHCLFQNANWYCRVSSFESKVLKYYTFMNYFWQWDMGVEPYWYWKWPVPVASISQSHSLFPRSNSLFFSHLYLSAPCGCFAVDYSPEYCECFVCVPCSAAHHSMCTRRIRWVEHVTCGRAEKCKGRKRQLGKPWHRWEDMKVYIKEKEQEVVDWIGCGSEQGEMRDLLNVVMNVQIP